MQEKVIKRMIIYLKGLNSLPLRHD